MKYVSIRIKMLSCFFVWKNSHLTALAKHPLCSANNIRLWGAGCLDDIWESNEWGQNKLLKYTLWMSWTNKWSSIGSRVTVTQQNQHELLETRFHCTTALWIVSRHSAYATHIWERNKKSIGVRWFHVVAMCMCIFTTGIRYSLRSFVRSLADVYVYNIQRYIQSMCKQAHCRTAPTTRRIQQQQQQRR